MNAMEKDNSVWKIGRRLKSSKKLENRPIHGATGLKYNALDKANAIADCLEDQFRTHEPDDDYLKHYREVRRSVRNFEHPLHQSECLDFTSSETRRLIGQLKVNRQNPQCGNQTIAKSHIKSYNSDIQFCIKTALFSNCMEASGDSNLPEAGERSDLSSEQKAYQSALWHWKSL